MSTKIIAAKLVKILENLDSVEKKGYNTHQKYYYMREVDVLDALKKQLVENKVILLTSSRFIEMRDKTKTNKTGDVATEFVTTVETSHRFIDSESGEELTITSVGSGYDSLDKGASKAITASVKYALMKTFMISDEGADIENDGKSAQPPAASTSNSFSSRFNKSEPAKAAPVEVAPPAPAPEPVKVEVGTPLVQPSLTANPLPSQPSTTAVKPRFGNRTQTVSKQEPKFP